MGNKTDLYQYEPTSELGVEETKEIEKKVAFELHDTQCKMIKIGGIANILGSLFIILVLWGHVRPLLLISWYMAVFLVNLINVILAFYYQRHSPSVEQIKPRLKIYHFILALLCIALGSMGVLFAPDNLSDQLFVIAFLLVILVCFSFGTITDFVASLISISFLILPTIIFRIYLAMSSIEIIGFDPQLNIPVSISFFIAGIFLLATCYVGSKLVNRSFHLVFSGARADDRVIRFDEFEKAVAFDDYAHAFDPCHGFTDPALDLIFGHDHPMHVGRAGIPETSCVFSLFVISFAPRANRRLVAQQIADATSARVFAA